MKVLSVSEQQVVLGSLKKPLSGSCSAIHLSSEQPALAMLCRVYDYTE